jgi:polyisoprenyl-phosphate glycosyltransferase
VVGIVMTSLELSVVIPVYRSEATVRLLVARLLPVLEATGDTHQIVLVDDGSDDGTWRVLCELQADHPDGVVAIQLMRNYGQHNALMCGFRNAVGDIIVTMDDDLQNPPEEIPKLLETIRAGGHDLVYGTYLSKKHSSWRNAGSAIVNGFYRLVFGNKVCLSSFRAIRRTLLGTILPYDLNFTFVDGLLAWNTVRIGQVEVEHHARTSSKSGYNLGKLLLLTFNLFTNFSLIPLQLVSACGLVVSTCGFLLALYYLIQAVLSQITVPGFASIIIAVLIIGGTQLVAIGIIGEYLGRLHLNVNRKPQYQVRSTLGSTAADSPMSERHAGVIAQQVKPTNKSSRLDAPHTLGETMSPHGASASRISPRENVVGRDG